MTSEERAVLLFLLHLCTMHVILRAVWRLWHVELVVAWLNLRLDIHMNLALEERSCRKWIVQTTGY